MPRYELVATARKLYRQGLSKRKIAKELDISPTTISTWCNEAPLATSNKQLSNYHEKQRNYLFNLDNIKLPELSQEIARIILGILYWCEGGKYPSTNRVDFTNSDEKMQVIFIQLLRKAFPNDIDKNKFRVWLQLHTSHNVSRTIEHWSKLLNLPKKQFIKPHLTTKNGGKYRRTYNGTCSIRYQDYRILLRIMGMYSKITKQLSINLS